MKNETHWHEHEARRGEPRGAGHGGEHGRGRGAAGEQERGSWLDGHGPHRHGPGPDMRQFGEHGPHRGSRGEQGRPGFGPEGREGGFGHEGRRRGFGSHGPEGRERGFAPQRPEARGRGPWGEQVPGRDPGPDPRRGGERHDFRGPGGHEHGPGAMRGMHGEGRERLQRGLLRFVILDVLSAGPQHGYEIIKQLEEQTGGRYSPSPGTLYPTLQYLEDLGYVSSSQDEGRRVYQITDSGRAHLDEQKAVTQGFWSRFRKQAPDAGSHEALFLQDAMNDLSRTVWSSLRPAMASGNIEAIRSIRQVIERTQNEIRDIIAKGAETQRLTNDEPQTSEH